MQVLTECTEHTETRREKAVYDFFVSFVNFVRDKNFEPRRFVFHSNILLISVSGKANKFCLIGYISLPEYTT